VGPGEFSADEIEHAHDVLRRWAIVFARRAQDRFDPGAPLGTSNDQRVAILVKGFGSTSGDVVMEEIAKVFRAQRITPCLYSYRGINDTSYSGVDSTRLPPGRLLGLAANLTDIIDCFPRLTELYLVAHSFGGNIVAQWLRRWNPEDEILQKLRWVTLLASPINLDPTRFRIAIETRHGTQRVDLTGYRGSYAEMLERTGVHVVIAEHDNVVLPPLSQPRRSPLSPKQVGNILGEPHFRAGHFDLPADPGTCSYVKGVV